MRGRPIRRLLAAALVLVALAASGEQSATAWGSDRSRGHITARNRLLRQGCHRYGYHYVVRPGSADWMLETWLRDPRGRSRGAGDFAAGSDPRHGRASFGICRADVVPGRFTIRARLSWWTPGMLPTDPPVRHACWLKPAHPRLRR
jgi:hypothetical protein